MILIYFTICVFIQKVFGFIIEILFSSHKLQNSSPPLMKFFVSVDDILNVIIIIFIFYIMFSYKLNYYIITILLIIFASSIQYFLINRDFIFLFIEDNSNNRMIENYIDLYYDSIQHFVLTMYIMYLLIRIYGPSLS